MGMVITMALVQSSPMNGGEYNKIGYPGGFNYFLFPIELKL